MDKSLTWFPTNTNKNISKWLANKFDQTAIFQCAEISRVDVLPCSDDYIYSFCNNLVVSSKILLGIYDRAQPSVCQFYTEIQSIINS